MSLSIFGVRSPLALVAILAISLLYSALAFAQDGLTNADACTEAQSKRDLTSDVGKRNILSQWIKANCNLSKNVDYYQQQAETTSPEFQDILGEVQTTQEQIESVEAASKQRSENASTSTQYYHVCKINGAAMKTSCQGTISLRFGSANSRYSNLMGNLNSRRDVQSSCNQISTYVTEAETALSAAESACLQSKASCQSDCSTADYTMKEARATMSEWDKVNRATGNKACSDIDALINEQRQAIYANKQNLQTSCSTATAALNQSPTNSTSDDEETSSASNNSLSNGLNNALAALPAMMSAMGSQPAPYYGGVDTATNQNYGGTYTPTTLAPVVSNPGVPTTTSDTHSGLGGDMKLLGPPEGYQKTKLSDVPQSPGGAGAMVGSNGGGAGPQAAGGKKKTTRGSKFDKDINAGYLGGGTPGRPTFGGGYPDAPAGRGGPRGFGPGPGGAVPGSLAAAMEKYRPSWFGRRDIATATGPDGITGPHTNLFRKVRIRYNEVPLGELAAISNRK